jgi:hypothetical protein
MAVIGMNMVCRVFADGAADRIALYALRDVTSGDTRDLAVDFLNIKSAAAISASSAAVLACTTAGTVVTIPAGFTADSGYLVVIGGNSGSPD